MPHCTIACIRGIAKGGPVDRDSPNVSEHGKKRLIGLREFTCRVNSQLQRNRNEGFEHPHIRSRRVYPQSDFIISRVRCGYQSYNDRERTLYSGRNRYLFPPWQLIGVPNPHLCGTLRTSRNILALWPGNGPHDGSELV